jgi:hypothetical protein
MAGDLEQRRTSAERLRETTGSGMDSGGGLCVQSFVNLMPGVCTHPV